MSSLRRTVPVLLSIALLTAIRPAAAQMQLSENRLSGPRVGLTVITGSNADRLKDELGIQPVITQFGWQFETELFRSADSGVMAVTEWIPLMGGLEQGRFLPSLSWLVGLRTSNGAEIAVGPNASLAGVGLAVAGGVSFSAGEVNIPLNFALVPSSGGLRVSVLSGFYLKEVAR